MLPISHKKKKKKLMDGCMYVCMHAWMVYEHMTIHPIISAMPSPTLPPLLYCSSLSVSYFSVWAPIICHFLPCLLKRMQTLKLFLYDLKKVQLCLHNQSLGKVTSFSSNFLLQKKKIIIKPQTPFKYLGYTQYCAQILSYSFTIKNM